VGFVQSPHDYRDWEHSLYQRMCYWEYRVFFSTTMASWNERGAAITVGTMALIRRQALVEAGGWSEWCLTEDSELAPRVHSLGYTSVYVGESFGRGLIPETFAGYAKQRRRWTYGPIQELKRHLPMFVPSRIGARTALTPIQKLFHLHHDLDPLFSGLGLLLLPWGLMLLASLLLHHERPGVPWSVLVAGTITAVASQAMSWSVQRRAMGCSLLDLVCASVAKCALAHSIAVSSLRAIVGVPLSWQRTDKFKAQLQGARRALSSASVELTLGLALLIGGMSGLWTAGRGLLLWLFIGVAMQGAAYLTAPAVALIAEWDLWRSINRPSDNLAEEAEAAA
jgi:cellulose synthase/poly-beta-1,6-N-acetylglucosamine synthase-like glycosyltransferase